MSELTEFFISYPSLAVLLCVLLALVMMYVLRQQAHSALLSVTRLIHAQLRLVARVCLNAAHRVRLRNHEVMNALARELMERRLEREFMRVEMMVEKDISNYQSLAAAIHQHLSRVNDDFEASSILPPASPKWIGAVTAIAQLKEDERNSEVVSKILSEVHNTVKQHQRDEMREYRWTVNARHKLLANLRPHWRRLGKLVDRVGGNVEALEYRLKHIDQQMERYELLQASPEQGLMASVFVRFLVSLAFVTVGAVAIFMNYQLLVVPLDAVLQQRQVGEVPLAVYGAGLHTAMLLGAATMVFEGLRITHLLPLMAAMTRRGRLLMITTGLGLLAMLSLLEAFAVAGFGSTESTALAAGLSSRGILFTLAVATPLMISLVIIPFEYLLYTIRPTLGVLSQILLHGTGLSIRMLGSMTIELGKLLVYCYDMIIFLPLKMEQAWQQRRTHTVVEGEVLPERADNDQPAENVTPLSITAKREWR